MEQALTPSGAEFSNPDMVSENHAKKPTHCALLAILGLTLLALALFFLNAVPDCRGDQQNDSFEYMALSRSLLDGQGYPSNHWMPGFPLLLTCLIGPFGANWVVLKLAMIGMALLGVSFSLRLFWTVTSRAAAVPLALVLASTPLYFDYAHRVMSEIPALTSAVAALVAMNEVKSAATRKGRLYWGMVLALVSVMAILIRGNALALAPALLVGIVNARGTSVRQTRWAFAIALSMILLAYGLWSLRCELRQFPGIHNVTYGQEVQAKDIGALWDAAGEFGKGVERIGPADFARRIYQNIAWSQAYQIARLFVPFGDRLANIKCPGLGLAIVALLLVPQLIGFIRIWSRSPELATFLCFSMALIIVYPTGGAPRMVLPFLPVVLLSGYLWIDHMLGPQRAYGWLLCLLTANLLACAIDGDRQRTNPYSREGFEDFVSMIEIDLPKASLSGERVGANLDTELFAIAGIRSQSISSISADVDAGRIASALIVHDGSFSPLRDTEAIVLAKRGKVGLIRITHKKAP